MKFLQILSKVVMVSDEDYLRLSKMRWRVDNRNRVFLRGGINTPMANVILGEQPAYNYHVDHIDGNPLNNQRENLRWVTQSQNMMNKRRQSNNTSGYRGVSEDAWGFGAYVWKDRKRTWLGHFPTAKLAAEAYNKAATIIHGQYAKLNIL